MTDDQHGEGAPRGSAGRWDPLPQGDYDDGATAFVKLPEGGVEALLASSDSPLAAPGHGYVPPQITVAPGVDPSGAGGWAAPGEGAQWPDPSAGQQDRTGQFTYNPNTTQQWNVEETPAAAAPGHDVTGQWSIPVADGELPDESGEFTTSSLVEQWGGTPPATLPGGAAAPWATQSPQPWGTDTQGAGTEQGGPGGDGYGPQGDGHGHARGPQGGATDGRGGSYGGHDLFQGGERAGDDGTAAPSHDMTGYAPNGDGHPETAEDPHARVRSAAFDGGRAVADAPERPRGSAAAERTAQGPVEAERPAQGSVAAERPASDAHPHPDTDRPSEAASRPSPGADEASVDSETPEAPEEAQGAVEAAERSAAARAELTADGDDTEAGPEAAEADDDQAPALPGEEHPLASYVLRVNGVDRPVTDAWIGESLLYVLRERLGLAGAKDGCSQGECGACNVQVDGRLVASCLVPAVTAAGSEVRTVEGLAEDGHPSDVQRALARCGAVQCGFCVPGMAMTVHDLLEGNPAPTELETRQALCGNLCRCSGYRGVVDAVKEVVAEREAHAAADAETDGDEARIPHQAGPGAGGVNPSAFEAPGTSNPAGPHEQAYGQGQDGGQA